MNPTAEIVIEARQTERNYWRDLWRHDELFSFLAGVTHLVATTKRRLEFIDRLRPFLTKVSF